MCDMAGHYRHTAVKALNELNVLEYYVHGQLRHINTGYGVHVNGLRLAEMLHSPAAGLLREQLASNGCLSRCDVMEVCLGG